MATQERSFSRRSYADMKERANQRGGGFDTYVKSSIKMYKVKDGKNTVRILPPTWKAAKHYGFDIWVNYGIGPDNQAYLSLSKMKNEPDPLAEARREADRADDEETARALQPRQRVAVWLIDRDAEDEGPMLWAMPFTVDKDIINIAIDDDTKEVTPLDDENEGNDLRFYKEGSGLNTKYPASKMKLLEPSPLSDDQKTQDGWMAYVEDHPIPECLQFYDYDHIAQVFNGHSRKPADDERPARRTRSAEREETQDDPPARRARTRDTDGNGADEAPPPRSSRNTRNQASADEDPPFETDERPARKPRARLETSDDDPPPRRAAARQGSEDAEEGGSIRDRLRRRRNTESSDEAD